MRCKPCFTAGHAACAGSTVRILSIIQVILRQGGCCRSQECERAALITLWCIRGSAKRAQASQGNSKALHLGLQTQQDV